MAIRNHWEIADAKVRGQEYRGVLNKAGELTGYFKMHQDENGEVEIGLGMRPEECGQGKGADFVKNSIRNALSIWKFAYLIKEP